MAAAWLAGALVFFREQWTSGFNKLMGNDGDARLIVYVCEHWFRVFHGQASWRNPQFYYPLKNLLGWSDTFFLFEVFYAPLRLVGFDPFIAMQLTIILLSLVGFASFFYLVRLAFGASRAVAVVTAFAFTFSNALWIHAGAFQDNGVYLIAALALVGLLAWRAARAGRRARSLILAGAFGLFYAGILYTTYYTSYFTLLAAATLLVVAAVLVGSSIGWQRLVDGAREAVKRYWALGAAAVGAFAVGVIPFVLTYLPAHSANGGSTYAEVRLYAGGLHDLVNVGGGNLIWTGLVRRVFSGIQPGYEQTYAVTPVLMIAALVGGVACLAWLRRRRAQYPVIAGAAVALAATAVIVALLPVHTPIGSAWAVIYHLPGASAMRAVDRIQIVVTLVVCLAFAAAATEAARHPFARQPIYRVATAAVLVLVTVEQINTNPTSDIRHNVQEHLIRSVTKPPPACKAFYVVDHRDPNLFFVEYQIDAMLISQKLSLPTLNGYTSRDPSHWTLKYLKTAAYLPGVASWAIEHDVTTGLCQLDLGTMTWAPAASALEAPS